VFVKSNLSSLNSQRHLNQSIKSEAKAGQRLGSGLRINGASDDAAGLAISQRMEASVRGSSKAIQSNQQSISLLQTAEGVLQEQTQLLQRMRQLTVQSLNGTNQGSDRASLQQEVSQLTGQFDQSAEVKFNRDKIFDRDVTLHFDDDLGGVGKTSKFFKSKNSNRVARQSFNYSQAGVNQEALLDGEITLTNKDGEQFSIRGTNAADDQISTANNEASAIAKAKVINEFSDETGLVAVVRETTFTGGTSISATTLDAQNYLSINGQKISGFAIRANDADSTLIDAINASHEETGVIAHLNVNSELVLSAKDGRNIEVEAVGNARNTGFGARTVVGAGLTLRSTETFDWSYSDEFVDAKLGYLFNNLIQLNPGTASDQNSIGPSWQFISTNAGANFVEPEWQGHQDNNIVLSGNYNGDIASAIGNRFHVEVDTVAGGVYLAALGAEDGNGESEADYLGNIPFDPSGAGTYIFASNDVALPPAPAIGGSTTIGGSGNLFIFKFQGANLVDSTDLDGDGVDAFQFTAPVGNLTPLDFVVGLGYDETVDTIDISTVNSAERALFTIDLALEELSESRSEYGAMINAFESAVRSLENEVVQLSSAQSRIKDADFAIETVHLTKAQISKEAGVSVLAQANAQSSIALSLLE